MSGVMQIYGLVFMRSAPNGVIHVLGFVITLLHLRNECLTPTTIIATGEVSMQFLRRLVPSLALVVVVSCFAHTQEFQWNNVQGVSSGERVKISLADGKSHIGEFQSATDTMLVISSKHGSESYARENVRHV